MKKILIDYSTIILRLLPDIFTRNRAYVIDGQGNKLFYGTVYACQKFIEYMRKG